MAELSVAGALAKARAALVAADTPTATLDARLLLQAVLQLDHADIISQPERRLSAAEQTQLEGYVERRLAHEPVSKILGQRDFYGRAFYVTADVLDPRADTETVIELALQAKPSPPPNVLDLGCGSGALICTLLAEWPGAAGVAVDVSAAALAVTQRNAEALGIGGRLQTLQGSWFGPVEGRFDLVVSNPPYIPSGEIAGLEPDVRWYDPHLALDGGDDGLDCYRAIAHGVNPHLAPEGVVIVEVGADQDNAVTTLFAGFGLGLLGQKADLGGHVRALAFARSPGSHLR